MADAGGIRAGRAYVELGATNAELRKVLDDSAARLRAWGEAIRAVGAQMVAVGGAALAGLGLAARQFAGAGAELERMSQRTGIAAQNLSEMQHATGQTGSDLAAFEGAVRNIDQRLIQAAMGSTEAAESFAKLGLSVAQVGKLSGMDRFNLIVDALAAIKNPAIQANQVLEQLGDVRLMPLVQGGTEGLERLRQEARDLGITMTGEAAKAALELEQALGGLGSQAKALGMVIGAAVAPALRDMVNAVRPGVAAVIAWVREHREAVVIAGIAAAALTGLGLSLVALGTALTLAGYALRAASIGVGALAFPIRLATGAVYGLMGALAALARSSGLLGLLSLGSKLAVVAGAITVITAAVRKISGAGAGAGGEEGPGPMPVIAGKEGTGGGPAGRDEAEETQSLWETVFGAITTGWQAVMDFMTGTATGKVLAGLAMGAVALSVGMLAVAAAAKLAAIGVALVTAAIVTVKVGFVTLTGLSLAWGALTGAVASLKAALLGLGAALAFIKTAALAVYNGVSLLSSVFTGLIQTAFGLGGALGMVLGPLALLLPLVLGFGAAVAAFHVGDAVASGFRSAKDAASGLLDTIKTKGPAAFQSVKDGAVGAWQSVKDNASAAWTSVKETGLAVWPTITTAIQEGRWQDAFKAGVAGIMLEWAKLSAFLEDTWLGFKGWFVDQALAIATVASNAFGAVEDAWERTTTALGNAWRTYVAGLKGGWDVMSGIFQKDYAQFSRGLASVMDPEGASADANEADRKASEANRGKIEARRKEREQGLGGLREMFAKDTASDRSIAADKNREAIDRKKQELADVLKELNPSWRESSTNFVGPVLPKDMQRKAQDVPKGIQQALHQSDVQGTFNASIAGLLGGTTVNELISRSNELLQSIDRKVGVREPIVGRG
jgi:hypothetical protein